MGNKLNTRRRSFSETEDRGQRRRKPTRSQSTSQVDGRNTRTSMPDLGGAVPYKPREDADVDVKLYRSFGNLSRPKSLGDSQPDIKIYRKSTDGLNKYASLPRHFGRTKSAASGVPNGAVSDYPELRKRGLPYDPGYPPLLPQKRSPPESESGRESQRASKRVSAASSLSSLAKAPVTMEDFPTTSQIKRKIKCFDDQFSRSLIDKYAGLADTLQLSALPIALARDSDGLFRQVSLLDYLDTDCVPCDLLAESEEDYMLIIPDALFHGIMHVRRDKISELELWTNLARDLVTCIAVEASNDISRMYEYQIALLTGDSAVRVLADHAAACVIEYIKKTNTFLDRNSAVLGVVKGQPSVNMTGAPKYLSVILGNRELKWDVQDVLKRPGLKKDLLLYAAEGQDIMYSPWQFFTSKDCDPQLYGYRGLLLEWDWVRKLYRVNSGDENSFNEDISDPMDYPEDFHRMYYPYKRLFGTDFMQKYCTLKQVNKINDSLAQYLNDTAGDATVRDHIQPVYRPLAAPSDNINYGTCNFDNVDLTRAQFKQADLSRTSVRNSKLLMTEMEGARFSSGEGPRTQMKGADVSYTTLAETTVDQQTLDGITAKHVVVMRPKAGRRIQKPSPPPTSDPEVIGEIPNGHDQQEPGDQEPGMETTPVTSRPKKKKRKVPKSLNIESEVNGNGDVPDGADPPVMVNGDHATSPEMVVEDYQETALENTLTADKSYISDSQGNLLEVDKATGGSTEQTRPKKVKRKVKKKQVASDNAGAEQIIEKKQKKIREKKKVKKRPVQPIATTPTEPIPETPVFVEEQQAVPQKQDTPDQTKHFFTDSQQFQQPAPVDNKTIVIETFQEEPGARRTNRSSTQGSDASQQSSTDYNILESVDNGTAPPEIVEETVTKTKTKKTKGKSGDKVKSKNGDKKRKKRNSTEPPPDQAVEIPSPGAEQYEIIRPHSSIGVYGQEFIEIPELRERPLSAIPDTYIDSDPVLPHQSPGKSLSTTNIHHRPYTDDRLATRPATSTGIHPRMTKSLSHHGNLGVGSHKLHNMSLDSHGVALRTARQIYGMSKEEIEFITRSQIFNMIKGLQIENIESNLPDANANFLGRDRERDDVTEMLSSSGRIVTVTGCYGNGKSALANAVACEIRKKFVMPILIDTRGCSSAVSVAHRMVSTFGLHFRFKELNLFYNWINCHEQRLLFVLDNLDIPAAEDTKLSDMIDDVMTNVKNIRVLCTSRRHFYKGNHTHEVYRLGNLDNSSLQLLKNLVPDLHDEGFDILADVCEDNPLVLNILSRTFTMDEVDSGKLFEELSKSKAHDLLSRVELALFDITEDDAELDVLRKLTSCTLKLLDNIPLGHAELLANASHFKGSFDAKTLADIAEWKDISAVTSALDELKDTGLTLKVGERYMLPSLIKFINQSKLPSDGSSVVDYYEKTIENIKLICAQYHSKRCDEAVQSFEDNYENYIDVLNGIIEREDVYELCPSFASLEYGLFFGECLPEDEYINFYESFAQEADDSDDVSKQCRSLCCLSHRFVLDENLPAAKHAMETVGDLIKGRASEISDTERALYWRCLGKIIWEEKEDRSRAVLMVKKALDLYKVAQGSRDLQTIYTNELYAWMLTRKDIHQTARHFYNISDLFVREMMDEHPLLVEGYDCRRSIWDRLCLFQRATDTAKKAVEVSKKFYGDHPLTATMMTHLCEAIIKRGSLNDAISAGIGALAIRSKTLGDHVDTGQSYKTLAYLMLRSGQYDEASRFGQSAVEVFDKVDAPEQLKIDVKNIIAQARYRLDYKSHVYVELQGRDASKKHVSNGHVEKSVTRESTSVSTTV